MDLYNLAKNKLYFNLRRAWVSIAYEHTYLYRSCIALFYRKRLPQQNGDRRMRRKRNLHAFDCMWVKGGCSRPPRPPHAIRGGPVYHNCPPPPPPSTSPNTKKKTFRTRRQKKKTPVIMLRCRKLTETTFRYQMPDFLKLLQMDIKNAIWEADERQFMIQVWFSPFIVVLMTLHKRQQTKHKLDLRVC